MLKQKLLIFLFLWHSSLYAVDLGFGTPINFTGRLFEPGCEFNGGKRIDINFGKVGIKKVDGVKYTQTHVISMNCKRSIGKKLVIQLQGDTLPGKNSIVPTSAPNLGISFKDGSGNPLQFNKFFDAKNDTTFTLVVTPVKKDVTQPLEAGHFTAVATLVSTYF